MTETTFSKNVVIRRNSAHFFGSPKNDGPESLVGLDPSGAIDIVSRNGRLRTDHLKTTHS